MSKESLKRKREIHHQAEDLTQQIQNLSKHNEMLSNRVRSLETEQERSKKKSRGLEGIFMFTKVAKNL